MKKNTLSIGMKHQREKEQQCEKHQFKRITPKRKEKSKKTKEKIVSIFDLSIQN